MGDETEEKGRRGQVVDHKERDAICVDLMPKLLSPFTFFAMRSVDRASRMRCIPGSFRSCRNDAIALVALIFDVRTAAGALGVQRAA